jgi:hypothetical protein
MRTTGERKGDGRALWTLVADPAAKLFVVDSLDDYTALAETYPQRSANPRNPTLAPDWAAVNAMESRPFDAVHMTGRGASASTSGISSRRCDLSLDSSNSSASAA